ncbi:MAG: hypothetical protein AAF517_22850, partial [Planctomycetota bacterium]
MTLGLTSVIAIGLWVSHASFSFAEQFIFGRDLNAQLIGLLLLSLLVLVTFSTVLISYTSLFIARETAFLFEHPIPPRTILIAKTIESVSYSAWASLFLCLPVLISFGALREVGPWYYAEVVVILVSFLLFAGLCGTALAVLAAPLLKRLGTKHLVVLALLILVGLSWIFLRSFDFWALDGENNLLVLERFMTGLKAMQSPYSPSRWATDAILAAANNNHSEVAFYSLVLLANTLIFVPILAIYAEKRYGKDWVSRRSYQKGGVRAAKRTRRTREHLFRSPLSSLVMKDLLVFLRNPAQVSQSLLFLLLMVVYSASLFRLPETIANSKLRIFIHFANIGAVCLILSSFTSRFLFPLLSLEGKAFWILGLAPISRREVVHQKVLFGLVISGSLGLLTIVASNVALKTPLDLFITAVFTTGLAATCLTCLATGLGAAYPNFEEDNPARIAAGL